jgi:4-hydroxy-3-polyprenylbenzoate decarboxylase
MTATGTKRILLAVTGASGAIYARQFVDTVRGRRDIELWVTASPNARRIFREELGLGLEEFWPDLKSPSDFDVPYVSGSARMDAMVVMPCSTGTLGRIAQGVSDDAITRAADVFLKEKRPLVLVPRETPLNLIHLRNLTALAEAGATILPAMPSFYGGQRTLEEATATVVARVLDRIGIENALGKRWNE